MKPAVPSTTVPGFETLTYSNSVGFDELHGKFARVARVGEEDAVVVYAIHVGTQDVLRSRLVRGAFTRWPPEIGPAVDHQSGAFFNTMGTLMAWPDGSFAVRTGAGTVVCAVDTPGSSWASPAFACFEPSPLEGVYVFSSAQGEHKLLHRSRRAGDANVTPCGDASSAFSQVVTGTGTLVMASLDAKGAYRLSAVSRSGVRKGATIQAAPRTRCFLVGRPGGGAFAVLAGRAGDITVHSVDDAGVLVGAPWTWEGRATLFAAAQWRSGFVLQTVRGPAAVVGDGVNATYSSGGFVGALPAGTEGSLASSADGRTVLFAYDSEHGPTLTRLVVGATDAHQAALPTKPSPAGTATTARPKKAVRTPSAPPFGTRDQLVSTIRRSGIADILASIRHEDGSSMLRGDARVGSFECDDGQGDLCVVFWDESGLVALGFDHTSPESEWRKAVDARDPGKHLRRVPAALADIAAEAAEYGQRLATEGYWVEAGAEPEYGSSKGDVLKRLLPSARRFGRDTTDVLVQRLATEDSPEISAEEGASLLARRGDQAEMLDPKRVDSVVRNLLRLGIGWPDAREAALEQLRQEQTERERRVSPADRALLTSAHAGDLAAVEKALAEGANIDVPMPALELHATPEGSTALVIALRQDHTDLARFLIERGADVQPINGSMWGGPETALLLAAGQGNVSLTRELLARGAKIAVGRGGVLARVSHPREHLRRGPPSAYAEVIRMLLEAGATLPSDGDCNELVKFVREGGAPELEGRLRRVYAEDVLPDTPAEVDTAVNATRVSTLLAEAASAVTHDTTAALRALTQAWRLGLAERVGDGAEALARMTNGELPSLASWNSPAKLDALFAAIRGMREGDADPRAARVLLEWLWSGAGYIDKASLARLDDEVAASLALLRDVRFIESLALRCELGRGESSPPTRESLKMALRVMRDVVPGPLAEVDCEHLGAIEDWMATRRSITNRPTIRELYDAVYDAPADEQARRALSGRLESAGDPRGEFIRLQLERGRRKPTSRETELLEKYGRAWLGEIGSLVADGFSYEGGFVERVTLVGRDGKGHAYRVLPTGAGSQREWSTVRCLTLAGNASTGLLRGSRTQGIAELYDAGPGHLEELLTSAPRPKLERLSAARVREPHWGRLDEARWLGLSTAAPNLLGLQLRLGTGGLSVLDEVVAGLPRLRELGLGGDEPDYGRLVELGRRRRLQKVAWLGLADLTLTLETGLLEVSFDEGALKPNRVNFAEEVLSKARKLGISRVAIVTPPRSKLETDTKGKPKNFKRGSEAMPLWPILEAAEALRAPCEVVAG